MVQRCDAHKQVLTPKAPVWLHPGFGLEMTTAVFVGPWLWP